jgi:hypothetical protein
VFIPPAWKLNDCSIKVLEKVGFELTETQERFLLLSNTSYKKIQVPKVFNWDSTGYPERNTINILRDAKRFHVLIKQTPPIVSIALHPRDPHQAFKEQKDMICKLIETGYQTHRYGEILPKLQHLSLSLPSNEIKCLENDMEKSIKD